KGSFDDVFRSRFDFIEIFRGKWALKGKVIEESILEGRADRQLCRRKDLFDGLGHNVGTTMAVDLTAFGTVELQWIHFSIFRQGARKIYGLAMHLRRKNIPSKRQAKSRQNGPNGLAGWNIPTTAIFERNFHDMHSIDQALETTRAPRLREANGYPQLGGRRGRSLTVDLYRVKVALSS